MEADKIVEAILFGAGRPVGIDEIIKAGIKKKNLEKAIDGLKKRYENSAIEIVEIDGKYVMQIRSEFAEHVKKFAPMNISKSVLKTLAIIAYHQPVKQSEMKRIVGSQIYEHVKELKKKGFIKTRREGRTKIIEVSTYFYDYFGFSKKNREKMKEILYSKIFNEERQQAKN
ncbi:MAG TPA: SMC-Scp complex subunit ScpB [Thermoplasmatales archaeon]|nr:SMC-Scp complex subunit ScpB [Thermoplasmatales archaeon]